MPKPLNYTLRSEDAEILAILRLALIRVGIPVGEMNRDGEDIYFVISLRDEFVLHEVLPHIPNDVALEQLQ